MIYWHYTVGIYIMEIIADNLTLRPGVPNEGFFLKGERPAIYFTRRARHGSRQPRRRRPPRTEAFASSPWPSAPNTAKGYFASASRRRLRLSRWDKFVFSGGLPRKIARGLASVARADGSHVKDWSSAI